jgi:hypothetical protein
MDERERRLFRESISGGIEEQAALERMQRRARPICGFCDLAPVDACEDCDKYVCKLHDKRLGACSACHKPDTDPEQHLRCPNCVIGSIFRRFCEDCDYRVRMTCEICSSRLCCKTKNLEVNNPANCRDCDDLDEIDGWYCPEHIKECSQCNEPFCSDHFDTCHICKNTTCFNPKSEGEGVCGGYCSRCNEAACKACLNRCEHATICDTCYDDGSCKACSYEQDDSYYDWLEDD